MSIKPKSHIQIALDSIQAFANDGQLDRAELQKLLDLATADGVVDEAEKATLRSVFKQAEKGELSADVKVVIEALKTQLKL